MQCPNCGTQNDPANRFCDQCGSRLEQAAPAQPAPTAVAEQPTAATALTCPNCHAPVLPGEAFCDDCGTPLNNLPVASADAPTVLAPAAAAPSAASSTPPPAATASGGDAGLVVCQVCGHQNLPGDQFCEACGAELVAAAAPTPAAPAEPAPSAPVEPAAPVAEAPPAQAVPIAEEPSSVPPAPEAAPTPAPEATPAPGPAVVPVDYAADRTRLEGIIAQQQQIIGQFEQMQATFGAAAPPAVTQGLDDARAALAQAQTELAALQPPAPAIDPAEQARLEGIIAQQQQIIGQFEQMQATFGAATPPAVTQGLDDARAALAQAQADLAALGGSAAPAPSTPAAPAPSTPEQAPPVAIPTPAAPRLVLEGGPELPFPPGKDEIIIGREDPISGIFPEVDLTPVGGETGGVSRQHARINRSNGGWTITDLNSTNYTRVDGTRLEPNVAVTIQDGSQLQFGRIVLTFKA